MNETILIIVAALLPVVVALIIIYRKDSNQPEPVGQLLKTFVLGALSAPLSLLLSAPFEALGLYSQNSTTIYGQIATSFFGAAIPEECFKLLMLWYAVRHNKYFDEHFDGIVYAVCIGMGFAGIENLTYLFGYQEDWVSLGITRALFSIPGHFFFAILMGYFYSLAYFTNDYSKKSKYKILTIAAPVLAHGLYDALLMEADILPEIAGLLTIGVIFLLNRLRKETKQHMNHLLQKDGVM